MKALTASGSWNSKCIQVFWRWDKQQILNDRRLLPFIKIKRKIRDFRGPGSLLFNQTTKETRLNKQNKFASQLFPYCGYLVLTGCVCVCLEVCKTNSQQRSCYRIVWTIVSPVNTPTYMVMAATVSALPGPETLWQWRTAPEVEWPGEEQLKIRRLGRRPKRSVCLLETLQLINHCIFHYQFELSREQPEAECGMSWWEL